MKLLVLGLVMLVASLWDFKTKEIPNWLILIGLILGLSLTFFLEGFGGLKQTLLSFCIVFLIFGSLWAITTVIRFKVLGAGDIKLFLVLSTFLNFGETMAIIYYSIIVGGILLLTVVSPKRIFEMFREFLYFFYYYIPGRKPESLQKRTFAPILFITLIADHFHLFDYLFS